MNTLVSEPRAVSVVIGDDLLTFELSDGRVISAPLTWYPRLLHATAQEVGNFRVIGSGQGVHWPDLDEDISVENLLLGRASSESQTSLQRWLESRKSV